MQTNKFNITGSLRRVLPLSRSAIFGTIILLALFAFEVFNYSTTEFALSDLLGNLRFAGVRWSTILSIAFCGIDFAGIARLFTPENAPGDQRDVWYLFGAWLLAATMNAMLTWWGVSLALLDHQTLGSAVIARQTIVRSVPIFIAVLVWLIRVLIIGTFSAAGERLFKLAEEQPGYPNRASTGRPVTAGAPASQPNRTGYRTPTQAYAAPRSTGPKTFRTSSPAPAVAEPEYIDADPGYQAYEIAYPRSPMLATNQPGQEGDHKATDQRSSTIRTRFF